MGLSTGKFVYARHRNGQNRTANTAQAQPTAFTEYVRFCCSLIWLICSAANADTIRVATFNVSLGRDGPGLLLKDLNKGADPQIAAVVKIIARVKPDILLLNDFDYDYGQLALSAFVARLAEAGHHFGHQFAYPSNAGFATDYDLDGDGWLNGPGDSQGFGAFSGAQGMAILSRFPVNAGEAKDFSNLLWRDLSGAKLPIKNDAPWPSRKAWGVQRLASKGHWDVPISLPDGTVLHLLASHATPPVFDGPENQNGLRNRDEIRFWSSYISQQSEKACFVILGDLNADPKDGEGSHEAINALLRHPLVSDPKPESLGAAMAAALQKGPNLTHQSPASQDTVDWDETRTPGNMRVDYVLPSASLEVSGAGVFWPAEGEDGYALVGPDGAVGSHHRLVWVDIVR